MSQLAAARRRLHSIRSLIRQGEPFSAVQVLREAVSIVFSEPLMKSEKREFQRMISDASYYIVCDQHIRKLAPELELAYVPGRERVFLAKVDMLLEKIDEKVHEDAQEAARLLLEDKMRQDMELGRQMLDAGLMDDARGVFAELAREHQNCGKLLHDIGGSFLRAGAYADAVCYLEEALKLEPGSLPVSSSLAVALRRMGRYAEAERVYLEALREGNGAPHLLFNLGRLYVDWKKWDRAVKAAQCALRLEPGFSEARRLLEYSERERERERERDAARKQLGLAQIGVHGGNGTDEIVRREQKLNAPLPCADENVFP